MCLSLYDTLFELDHFNHRYGAEQWCTLIGLLSTREKARLPALTEVRIPTIFWPVVVSCYDWSGASFVAHFLHEAGLALADGAGTRWQRFSPVSRNVLLFKQRNTAQAAAAPDLMAVLAP
ncbi:hypothetical protein BD413DRAFT_584421 [Trametes elegans]|nr:hypothetical protein BD413DRAFT_584421 [Trametes elegans]